MILQFLFDIFFILIGFQLVWGFIMWLIRVVLGIDFKTGTRFILAKSLFYFVVVTLLSTVTMNYINNPDIHEVSQAMRIGIPILTGILLLFFATTQVRNNRLRALVTQDERLMRMLKYESIFAGAALIFYYFTLNLSYLANNKIGNWFMETIRKMDDLLLFRWVISLLAIFAIFRFANQMVVFVKLFIQRVQGKQPKQPGSSSEEGDIIDVEYEEAATEEHKQEELPSSSNSEPLK